MAILDVQGQILPYIPLEQEIPFSPVVLCSDILFPLFSSFLSPETFAVSWPRKENDVGWGLMDSGVSIPTLSWFSLLPTAFHGHRFISRQDSSCLVGLQTLPVLVCSEWGSLHAVFPLLLTTKVLFCSFCKWKIFEILV